VAVVIAQYHGPENFSLRSADCGANQFISESAGFHEEGTTSNFPIHAHEFYSISNPNATVTVELQSTNFWWLKNV
jgi:hypothetical protein